MVAAYRHVVRCYTLLSDISQSNLYIHQSPFCTTGGVFPISDIPIEGMAAYTIYDEFGYRSKIG